MDATLSRTADGSSAIPATHVAEDFADAVKKPTPLRILVVDDDRLVRWSIGETLTDEGYDVREAGDAATALHELATAGADVVLLDVYLPDSDNLGVLAAMRRLSPGTAIILMTAHSSPALIDRARRLGAFTVLDKPFELSNLRPLVECASSMRLQ